MDIKPDFFVLYWFLVRAYERELPQHVKEIEWQFYILALSMTATAVFDHLKCII